MRYQLKIGATDFTVDIGEVKAGSVEVVVNGRPYDVRIGNPAALSPQPVAAGPVRSATTAPATTAPAEAAPAAGKIGGKMDPAFEAAGGAVVAPIPGLILEIKVQQGDSVSVGQIVATMEAMKMENNLTAPVSGVVRDIRVQKGAEVSTGEVIMRIG